MHYGILIVFCHFPVFIVADFEDVRNQCRSDCRTTLLSLPLPGQDVRWARGVVSGPCDWACHRRLCEGGCGVWALGSACGRACNTTACAQGCGRAEALLGARLGALLDSAGLTTSARSPPTLDFQWTLRFSAATERLLDRELSRRLKWYAQIRPEFSSGAWETLDHALIRTGYNILGRISIVGLQPLYPSTHYELRLIVTYDGATAPLVSRAHNVVSSSDSALSQIPAPKVVTRYRVREDQEVVCWEAGEPRNLTLSYRVVLLRNSDGRLSETTTEVDGTCFAFTGLRDSTEFRAQINPRSASGIKLDTPQIQLPPAATERGPPDGRLIYANATHVGELRTPGKVYSPITLLHTFDSDRRQGETFTALCAGDAQVFVGTSAGRVFLIKDDGGMEDLEVDGAPVIDVELDPGPRRLYVLRERGIYARNLGDILTGEVLIQSWDLAAIDIALDYWNGFCYLLSGTSLYRMPLPVELAKGATYPAARRVATGINAEAISVDYANAGLIIAERDGAWRRLDFVTGQEEELRFPLRDSQRHRASATALVADAEGRRYWVASQCEESDECLWFENYKLQTNTYTMADRELNAIAWAGKPIFPQTLLPPTGLAFLPGVTSASLSWSGLRRLPFQGPLSAGAVAFFGEVRDAAGTSQLKIDGTLGGSAALSGLRPGSAYTARLRACLPGTSTCSDWAEVGGSTLTQGAEFRFGAVDKDSRLHVFTSEGKHEKTVTIPWDLDSEKLACADVDLISGNYYVCRPDGIHRVDSMTGTSSLAVRVVGARSLAVSGSSARLAVGSAFAATEFRLPGTLERGLLACATPGRCPELLGLAALLNEWRLLVREGDVVRLLRVAPGREPEVLAEGKRVLPRLKAVRVLGAAALLVLTEDGRLGILNADLKSDVAFFPLKGDSPYVFLVGYVDPVNTLERVKPVKSVDVFSKNGLGIRWALGDNEKQADLYNLTVTSAQTGETLESRVVQGLSTEKMAWNVSGRSVRLWVTGLTAWDAAAFSTAATTPFLGIAAKRLHFTHRKSPANVSVGVAFSWAPNLAWQSVPYGYRVSCSYSSGGTVHPLLEPKVVPVSKPVGIQREGELVQVGSVGRNVDVSCAISAQRTPDDSLTFEEVVAANSIEVRPLVELVRFGGTGGVVVGREDPVAVLGSLPGTFPAAASLGQQLFLASGGTRGDSVRLLRRYERWTSEPVFAAAGRRIQGLTADWVLNRLYVAAAGDAQGMSELSFLQLPDVLEGVGPADVAHSPAFDRVRNFGQMVRDPFVDSLYVTGNDSLLRISGSGRTEVVQASCLVGHIFAPLASSWKGGSMRSPELILAHHERILAFDTAAKTCRTIITFANLRQALALRMEDLAFFAASAERLYLRGTAQGNWYSLPLGAESRDGRAEPSLAGFEGLLTASQQFQPYPNLECLRPSPAPVDFDVSASGRTGLRVDIKATEDAPTSPVCQGIARPQSQFLVMIKDASETDLSCQPLRGCVEIRSSNRSISATELLPATRYSVFVGRVGRFSAAPSLGRAKTVETGEGIPGAPAALTAVPVAPDQVLLLWALPTRLAGPRTQLRFSIRQSWSDSGGRPTVVELHSEATGGLACDASPCRRLIHGLRPSTKYTFIVSAWFPGKSATASEPRTAATLPEPGILQELVEDREAEAMRLKWLPNSASSKNIACRVEYMKVGTNQWEQGGAPFAANEKRTLLVDSLTPQTIYSVRYTATYDGGRNFGNQLIPFTAVYKSQPLAQTIETPKAGLPAPRNLQVSSSGDGKKWTVSWDPPTSVDGLKGYRVEYRFSRAQPDWSLGAKDLKETHWSPTTAGLPVNGTALYRVAAEGADGRAGRWATLSAASPSDGFVAGVVVAIIIVAIVLILCLIVAVIMYRRRRRAGGAEKKVGGADGSVYYQSGASTVVTVLDRSSDTGAIEALKAISPAELNALPHVQRSCITISKMLGKGAFGEVYEGLACNLPKIGPKSHRIAIKTLRQNSRDEEKIKFLKEAVMMSTFDHENIVRLMGVCLDSEPQWIILELMEGGDLLSFLRSVRPTQGMASQVSLRELVTMAVDVVGGCAYLEAQHHVHRDLAARNCLLSTRDPAHRRVKIADFGLTRDVYTEDYYRVEGQGLLPIRWMAAESMVDGVFTHKTDVWSLGVVLWELLSLGQQPYPGRSNWDVLNFVRIGGLLDQPAECPQEIYNVMLDCWTFKSELRPSMHEVLDKLRQLTKMPHVLNDDPFPSSVEALGGGLNYGLDSSAGTSASAAPVTVFATPASGDAAFQRNEKASQSLRHSPSPDGAEVEDGRRKVFGFRSFRKNKPRAAPANPPPSRLDVNFNVDGTLSRPTSGASYAPRPSSSESFTTLKSDYEVPLFKGTTNHRRQERQAGQEAGVSRIELGGTTNPAYLSSPSPDSPTKSLSTFK